ncbi:MAG: HAMP domain-containing sensor histidine kinase [Balneolaceae bacterium]
MGSPPSKETQQLADYLEDNKDAILKVWEEQVTEKHEEPSALVTLSREEFYDSIPDFIKSFCNDLREEEVSMGKVSRKHGTQRWEHGVNLPLLTEEWSILFFSLTDFIYEARDQLSLNNQLVEKSQKRLGEFILAAIKNSVAEYHNLEQLKAEAQVGDLEEIIQENKGLIKDKAYNLQGASHDLGGSMVVVKMNLSMLKETELNDEARKLVDQLELAAENLSQLLDNLLSLFRLEAGREKRDLKNFDAAEILHDLGKNMQPLAEAKKIELRIDGEQKLPVEGDSLKVKRIAQNLILNSLKYTEEGYVEINWRKESQDHWLLTVSDTGPGIDDTNAKLFTDASGEKPQSPQDIKDEEIGPNGVKIHSEGIGLLIVRQLCELLDAIVNIEGEKNKGTTFSIIFPTNYTE